MSAPVSRRAVLHGGALSALALIAAACGGGGDGDSGDTTVASTEPEDTTPATDAATTTTRPRPTTTASTTPGETTTTVPLGPTYPLTGVEITDQATANRPALVAKIDNHPQARPQFGLNAADIVYEENVESLTRFAAVYHSQNTDRVGPVRSGRTQDVDLLGSYSAPLFVWSGGNGRVTTAINGSDLVNLSPTTTRNVGFFRERRGNETSEHTLYARPAEIYAAFTPVFAPAPPPQFVYRAEGEAFNGEATKGVEIEMDGGVDVTWNWDPATASYLRSQDDKPHEDATMGQVSSSNIVVLEVDYRPSPADARSPEAQTVGGGVAYVFTGGVMVTGTWQRDDRLSPVALADANGEVIALTPGRTWVELARVGRTTPIV